MSSVLVGRRTAGRNVVRSVVLASTALVAVSVALPALADTYTVTDSASLAAAIAAANANPGADTIVLANDITGTLLPAITDSLTIDGGGFTLDGGGSRIFFVDAPGGAVSFINFASLTNGLAAGGDGAGLGGGGLGAGGAIFVNAGDVTLTNVSFAANSAIGGDGGSMAGEQDAAGGGGGLGGDGGGSSYYAGGGGGGFSGGGGGGGGTSTYVASYYYSYSYTELAGSGGAGAIGDDGGAGSTSSAGSAGFGSDAGAGGAGQNYSASYYYPGGSSCYYSWWGGSYCYYYSSYYSSESYAAGGGGGGGGTGAGDGGSGYAAYSSVFGGGGGGGGGLSGTGGNGGNYAVDGGNGTSGSYGGGGGGGTAYAVAGDGGMFGGGGGSSGTAGAGGFGGGGGGARNGAAGSGGFGGGSGGSVFSSTIVGGGAGAGSGSAGTSDPTLAGGGGGAGLGGAVFVNAGASLTIGGNVGFTGGSATGGFGGGSAATGGTGGGSDLFLMSGTTTGLAPGAGNTIVLTGTIGDDSATSLANGTGSGATIAVSGGGTVRLDGTSSIAGGFTVGSDTALAVGSAGVIGAPGSAVRLIGSGSLLDNMGTIGNSGASGDPLIAIQADATVINRTGGTLFGPGTAIEVSGGATGTIDLQAASTTTGDIRVADAASSLWVNVDGTLNGLVVGHDGEDRLRLGAYGTIGGVSSLGGGDDRMILVNGGAHNGVDGGAGSDTLFLEGYSALPAMDLASLTNFENLGKSGAGTLTITSVPAGFTSFYAGDGGDDDGVLAFDGTSGLTGDIYVNGAILRADSAGAFGNATIHMIDPTIQFGATGTYTNNIALEVASPASADPTRLEAINGSTATLTGVIATGTTPTTDPVQYVTIGGDGTIVLTNAGNSWTGTTRIESGATLRGASDTISGGTIIADGALAYDQSYSGTVAQDVSGGGRITVSGLTNAQTLTFAGDLTNHGVTVIDDSRIALAGTNSTSGDGVVLSGANGIVDVADGASLSSPTFALLSTGANATLNNLGAISSNYVAVRLNDGGTINNGSASDATASISALYTGSSNVGDATLNNYGVVSGYYYNGLDGYNLTVGNFAGGQISGIGAAGYGNGVGIFANGTLTLDNQGQIVGRFAGVHSGGAIDVSNSGLIGSGYLTGTTFSYSDGNDGIRAMSGGTIDNQAGGQVLGSISGIYSQNSLLTLSNAGTISGGQNGIYAAAPITLTNAAGGSISGANNAVYATGGISSVTNSGTISSASGQGVYLASGGTVSNLAGTISGGTGAWYLRGVLVQGANGSVTNAAGATISGGRGVDFEGVGGAVVNAGTITGTIDGVMISGTGSVTNQSTGLIAGSDFGVRVQGAGSTVSNAGSITANGSQPYYYGVRLDGSSASLTNLAGATISGGGGVYLSSSATLTNSGSISGTNGNGDGVQLAGLATITNQSGGSIGGGRIGIASFGPGLTLTNSGAISGNQFGAVYTSGGTNSITNNAGGTITGTGSAMALNIRGATTVDNSGTLSAVTSSVNLNNGGSVFNRAGGTISSTNGNGVSIYNGVAGANRIENYGTVNSGSFALSVFNGGTIINGGSVTAGSTGNAITLDGGGSVTNLAGGVLTANQASDAWGILAQGNGAATIDNRGTINAGSGLVTNGANTTMLNSGSVFGITSGVMTYGGVATTLTNSGTIASATGIGVDYSGSGTVNNLAGGVIQVTGSGGAGVQAIGALTLNNAGMVSSSANDAIHAVAGATIDNSAGGQIDGGNFGINAGGALTLTNAGTIAGDNSGIFVAGAATIANSGSISGNGTAGYNGDGISASSSLNLTNSGSIAGGVNAGVVAYAGGLTIDNQAGGTISGGSNVYGMAVNSQGTLNLINAGTLSAGSGTSIAVQANGDASMTLASGSVVNGHIVQLGGTTSTLSVGGSVTGGYTSGGTAVDSVTLAATGSLGGASLGAGNDTLTINGGTLTGLASGGADTDTLTFNLAGNASFDAGYFAGFESRSKVGAGTLTLTGTDAMTIDFAVNGGTLAVSGGSAINDGAAVSLAAGTTLALNNSEAIRTLSGTGGVTLGGNTLSLAGNDSGNFGGSITGTGNLAKFGTGVFTLTGGNGYTGTTYVMGGTLAIGSSNAIAPAGALFVDSGATFNLAGFNQTFAGLGGNGSVTLGSGRLTVDNVIASQFGGSISGTGGLTKSGSGLLLLNGASTYTGSTLVNGGTLSVNGSLASVVTVNSGGTLAGTGSVGGLVVNAGGILSPGNEALLSLLSQRSGIGTQAIVPMASYDTFTITGNATFNAGSFYDVDINPTMSDLTVVTGTTTINGGTVRVNAEDATYNPLSIYTILQSNGGVTGTFSGVTDNLAYLDTSLSYTSNQVRLEARRNDIIFSDVADNPNQAGVADAVQSIGSGALYDAVLVQSEAGARSAFNALSGEIYAATPTVLLDGSRHVRNAMLNADRGAQGFGAWLEGTRSQGNIEVMADRGTGEVEQDRDQLAGGITYGAGSISLGAMLGRASTDVDLDARMSSAKVRSTFVGGQLGYRAGAMTVRGGGAYAWHDVSTDRSIVFPGFAESARSSQDGRTMQVWGDAGIDLARSADVLEPFAGFALVDSKVDGTAEDGGVSSLDVGSVDQTVQLARFGLRVKGSVGIAGAKLSPRMSVAVQRGWGDLGANATSAFTGSDSFTVTGARLSKDSVLFEGGVDLDAGPVRVGVRYDGALADGNADHSAKATLSFRF